MKFRGVEETVIALPKEVIQEGETIGSIPHCDDDAEFGMDSGRGVYLVKLQPGMTMSLSRSSEAMEVIRSPFPRQPAHGIGSVPPSIRLPPKAVRAGFRVAGRGFGGLGMRP